MQRNTAKEGDLLCVSGDLGAAYMGLTLLQREKHVFLNAPEASIDLAGNDFIVGKQLKPEARKDIVEKQVRLIVAPICQPPYP